MKFLEFLAILVAGAMMFYLGTAGGIFFLEIFLQGWIKKRIPDKELGKYGLMIGAAVGLISVLWMIYDKQ